MANTNTPKKSDTQSTDDKDKSKASSELAEPSFAPGQQTVDPKEDKVLPESKPGDLAPVPDAAGNAPTPPESSSTGYRVAEGRSITAKTGDLLNSGEEIGPDHVGGQERLDELVEAKAVTKVGGGGAPSSTAGSKSGVNEPKPPQPSGSGTSGYGNP